MSAVVIMRVCSSWVRGGDVTVGERTVIVLDFSLSREGTVHCSYRDVVENEKLSAILHAKTCLSFPNSFLGDSNMSLEIL